MISCKFIFYLIVIILLWNSITNKKENFKSDPKFKKIINPTDSSTPSGLYYLANGDLSHFPYIDQYKYCGRRSPGYSCASGGSCALGVGSQGPYCNQNGRDVRLIIGCKCNIDADCVSGFCSQGCDDTGYVCAPHSLRDSTDWAHGHGIMTNRNICNNYGYRKDRDPILLANKKNFRY